MFVVCMVSDQLKDVCQVCGLYHLIYIDVTIDYYVVLTRSVTPVNIRQSENN